MSWNVSGSGIATMSDSSIALNPVIDEPSKPIPSSSASSSSAGVIAKLLRWPSRSVNQSRTNSTDSSFMRSSTSARLNGSLVALGAVSIAAIKSSSRKTKSPGRHSPEATSPQRLVTEYIAGRWNAPKSPRSRPCGPTSPPCRRRSRPNSASRRSISPAHWLARLPSLDGWHCFVAYDGEQPAAAGALYVVGKLAWLGIAATVPGFRRRGAQTALLAARIRRASELGCTLLVTETGEAVDGRPAGSYRNILRAGFEPRYLR